MGPKVGMFVRQYEIVCANDAGRAPRKYPDSMYRFVFFCVLPIWNLKLRLHGRRLSPSERYPTLSLARLFPCSDLTMHCSIRCALL